MLQRIAATKLRQIQESKASDLKRYANDPVGFAVDILGVQPWERQQDILEAIRDYSRVAVRSGHKIGKSNTDAIAAIWWAATRDDGRVILTAPSYRQVESILWREITALCRGKGRVLGASPAKSPETGMRWPDGREILGFSTNEPERFAGISGANVLFIPDEASGIDEPIFQALEGNRAGGARLLMTGNPTKTSGTFYEAFTTKAEFYRRFHVASWETPNVVENRIVISGLATAEWVAEKKAEWGEDSPIYQVRVAGNFPDQASDAVIGVALVVASRARYDVEGYAERTLRQDDGLLEIGVDPAGFGDDEAVIYGRRGYIALPPDVFRHSDGEVTAGRLIAYVRKHRDPHGWPREKPVVRVDTIGVGASTVDHLKPAARAKEIELVPVNVAEAAPTADLYMNTRAQVWFATRDWLKEGGCLPDDPKLEAELVAPRYSFDAQGRYRIESKDDIKERLGRSPDRADALGLAIYRAPQFIPRSTRVRGM